MHLLSAGVNKIPRVLDDYLRQYAKGILNPKKEKKMISVLLTK